MRKCIKPKIRLVVKKCNLKNGIVFMLNDNCFGHLNYLKNNLLSAM